MFPPGSLLVRCASYHPSNSAPACPCYSDPIRAPLIHACHAKTVHNSPIHAIPAFPVRTRPCSAMSCLACLASPHPNAPCLACHSALTLPHRSWRYHACQSTCLLAFRFRSFPCPTCLASQILIMPHLTRPNLPYHAFALLRMPHHPHLPKQQQ